MPDPPEFWTLIESCIHGHIACHSDHRARIEVDGCMRTFALDATKLQVSLACQTACVQLSTSGRYTKADVFWVEQDARTNPLLFEHIALMCKFMLIVEAIASLEGTDVAFARDTPTGDGLLLDIVIRPLNTLLCSKYRFTAIVPRHGAIVASVIFTEQYWNTPTVEIKKGDMCKRKHFKTVHTLVDFVLQDRRRWG